MIEFVTAVSLPFVIFVAVLVGGGVALTAIVFTARAARRKDEIKHQEYDDTIDTGHRERLAQIGADRDIALAKMGVKLTAGGMLQLQANGTKTEENIP